VTGRSPSRSATSDDSTSDSSADSLRTVEHGSTAGALTSSRLLARNSLLNLGGHGAPLLVALVAIPLLVEALGTERFGVLTLAWMAIGYFSVFDLGLGRALTQLVAERLGRPDADDVGPLVWTALLLVLAFGVAGGLLLALLTPWLVGSVLRIPPELVVETRRAFYLLAFALPWVISMAALRGYLEAQQRFGLINAIRVPLGVLTFAGPLAVLPFSVSLVPVVAVLVAGRVAAWAVHLWFCHTMLSRGGQVIVFSRSAVLPLLRFGSWMTVSNAVSPLMVYVDRFLIGGLLSMSAVAYYVTPYEVVTRLWLIPSALLAVFFPAFAASFGREPARMLLLFDRGLRAVFLAMFPLTLVLVAFAAEGLWFWLGEDFSRNGYRVLQWLAVGVFINSVGQVAFSAIQGAGRPDITGKLHLTELPVYVIALWLLLRSFGIEGVAIAWTLRVTADALVLLVLSNRFLPAGGAVVRRTARLMVPALAVLSTAAALQSLELRLLIVGAALGIFAWAAWRHILTSPERATVLARWGAIRGGIMPS
jgi:O-antigen/teichoic acid export membrane protein